MDLKTKLAAVGLSAGLLGGGTAGVLLSQASGAGAADNSSTTSVDAGATNATHKPGDGIKSVLDGLVKDGTLTQAQSDKVLKALEAARPKDGPGGPGGRGGHGPGARKVALSAAATALGMTEADLRTALESGKTIAAIAKEKNVDVNTVISALVAEAKTHLDAEVKAGTLTQAEADTRLAEVKTRITDMVNNGRPARPAQNGTATNSTTPSASPTAAA